MRKKQKFNEMEYKYTIVSVLIFIAFSLTITMTGVLILIMQNEFIDSILFLASFFAFYYFIFKEKIEKIDKLFG